MTDATNFPFKSGDVVVLRSGSVPMTIMAVEDDAFHIGWFSLEQGINASRLPLATAGAFVEYKEPEAA